MPRVEVRNAGLRTSPSTVVRSGVPLQRVELSPLRLVEKQHGNRQQEAGSGRDVERKPPAVLRSQIAAQQVSRRRAHRNRQIEHAQNPTAFFFGEKIGDESRRNGDERRFTDTDQGVPNQQLGVVVGEGGQQREAAPEDRSQHDDELARIAVCQRANERRGHHVEAQERAGEIADLRLGEVELVLHQRLHREQHVAVDIIQQVQRREHDQRGARLEFRGGHRSSEYSMTLNQNCIISASHFARGHFATTVVEIPPRGRNSPLTSAHTGFAQRTTSSSTRFTMFS